MPSFQNGLDHLIYNSSIEGAWLLGQLLCVCDLCAVEYLWWSQSLMSLHKFHVMDLLLYKMGFYHVLMNFFL